MSPFRRFSKTTITLIAAWVVFCGWVVWGWWAVRGLQESPYEVSQRHDGYEVREYGPLLAAQVSVVGSWSQAWEQGFVMLENYLSGDNTVQESIAMKRAIGMEPQSEDIAGAVPVLQQERGGVWLISFVLPPQWTDVTVPRPNDPRVRIVRLPARTIAAVTFSGRAAHDQVMRNESRLRESLAKNRAVITGPTTVAQYHLPGTPPFLRHNEILIPIR